jgi:hypothetical protein
MSSLVHQKTEILGLHCVARWVGRHKPQSWEQRLSFAVGNAEPFPKNIGELRVLNVRRYKSLDGVVAINRSFQVYFNRCRQGTE